MFKSYYFRRLSSTNEKAKEFVENSVIIADEQIKGEGRFNRSWSSSKGGIYMSIILKENTKPQYLTFIAAISAQKAIKDILEIKTTIKWPNDLIYHGKKICGILTQCANDKSIIGIGLNTNNIIPKSLNKEAVSLNEVTNKKINNKKIIKKILAYFEGYLKLLRDRKYSKIISEWKRNSFLGSEVMVKSWSKEYYGKAFDVDKDCFLIIKDKKGRRIKIIEGDVFVL